MFGKSQSRPLTLLQQQSRIRRAIHDAQVETGMSNADLERLLAGIASDMRIASAMNVSLADPPRYSANVPHRPSLGERIKSLVGVNEPAEPADDLAKLIAGRR